MILQACDIIKINSHSIESPHAHFQCVHSMSAKFQKHSLKNVGGIITKSLHTLQCKKKNAENAKCGNSVIINSSSIKTAHAHVYCVYNKHERFLKDPLKTVGDVDYTNFIPYNEKIP